MSTAHTLETSLLQRSSSAGAGVLGTVGLNMSLAQLLQRPKTPLVRFLNHAMWRRFCSFLTIAQFVICVLQVELEHAHVQCRVTSHKFSGCESLFYVPDSSIDRIEAGFNVTHLLLSALLLFDIICEIWQKGALFFVISFGNVAWVNVIDALLQVVIFLYVALQLAKTEPSSVNSKDFIAICVLRLMRVYVASLPATRSCFVT
jgi:hypothetical protein